MNQLLIYILLFFVSMTLISIYSRKQRTSNSIDDFLLANKQLSKSSVANLLLSASFGANAIFYAAWLGYTVGIWALIIQGAWALSFILLSYLSKNFYEIDSLHDLLGKKIGKTTKILASICSILGVMFLVGWEVGIVKSSIESLSSQHSVIKDNNSPELLIFITVVGTLLYTIIGGLRGNAFVNIFLNLFKIIVILMFLLLIFLNFDLYSGKSFNQSLFPPFSEVIGKLGWWGLITNIVFNITWQFVDNSSWQSIISGTDKGDTKSNMQFSGLYVFLSIGVIGTLYGASLINIPDVNEGNILSQILLFSSPNLINFVLFGLLLLLITSMISMLDGMFLAIALTFAKDIFTYINLKIIKFILLPVIAGISIWGIEFLQRSVGIQLFDLVYVVIISQLSLFGPVMYGLLTNDSEQVHSRMWIAIITALVVGASCVIYGSKGGPDWILKGAGTLTLLSSLFISCLVLFISYLVKKK